ncbi:MAG TPA: hypothetical protein VN668_18870 [Stellaceae bacterium]|nr:hypothetical protein [Stellaceae bacterium]
MPRQKAQIEHRALTFYAGSYSRRLTHPGKSAAKLLIFATLALASFTAAARAADGCCIIMAIDGKSGVVTAADKTTGREFQFRAVDAHTLQALHVGESIDVNSGGQVSVASSSQ